MRCKFSKIKLKPFMSFGKMPMANGFLSKKDFHKEFFYNLEVGFNKKNYLFQVYMYLLNAPIPVRHLMFALEILLLSLFLFPPL